MKSPTTKEIPAWSRNLTANAPADWRDALAAQAREMKITFGELIRRLILAGAVSQLPGLASRLVKAHRQYYPARTLSVGMMAGALLLLFCFGLVTQPVGQKMRCHRGSVAVRAHRVGGRYGEDLEL